MLFARLYSSKHNCSRCGFLLTHNVFSGGAVTRDEFRMAIERRLPVIVVRHSGHFANVLAAQYDGDSLEPFDEKTQKLATDAQTLDRAKTRGLVSFANYRLPLTLNKCVAEVLP